MTSHHPARRRLRAVAAAAVAVCLVTACSHTGGSGSGSSGAAGGTYTIWDPYPQFDDGADWVKLLQKCGTDAGVTVKRTAYDTTDLTNKALLAAQQGNSPTCSSSTTRWCRPSPTPACSPPPRR